MTETNRIIEECKNPGPEESGRGRSKYRCGRYDVVKRRHKDRENSANVEIPYFFYFVGAFHDTRMHKWRGPVVPPGLLLDKLCRFGPIGSRPTHDELA